MNDERLEELRAQISAELETTRMDVERLEKSAAPVSPDNALGRLTRMDSLNDQGLGVAALSQKREKLYNLEKAMENIGKAGFGSCTVCQLPIPIERLMALPETTRCVNCAR